MTLSFNGALKKQLDDIKRQTSTKFNTACCSALNKPTPIKIKMLRHMSSSFMKKDLRKALMHRSKLKNIVTTNTLAIKTGTNIDDMSIRAIYNCVSLFRETEKQEFENLNVKGITNINTF